MRCILLCGILLAAWRAQAAPVCRELELDASISPALDWVRGTVTCTVARSGPLAAAAYPRVLRQPHHLDDINSPWFYPDGFSPAEMQLWRDGAELRGDGAWQELGTAAAGSRVTLHFATRIPNRNGTFGSREGVAYLLGGWHPIFGAGERAPPALIRYRVRLPPRQVGFVGTSPYGRDDNRVVTGTFSGKYLPVLVAPQLQVTPTSTAILVVPRAPTPAAMDTEPGLQLRDLTDPLDAWAHAEILQTLADGALFAAAGGLPERPLIAVVMPLRAHLAEPFDAGIAISDRAFHVLPVELVYKFHRASLWREQLSVLAYSHAALVEQDLPPEFAADMVGSTWAQSLFDARYGAKSYVSDMIDAFAVIPEIDALEFAPQLPFIDTYYNAIDEAPPARIRLDDFYHPTPRGKLLFEKLKDRVGLWAVREIVRQYVRGQQSLFATGQRVTGQDVALLAQPWLGPYPRVNYFLADIQSSSTATRVTVGIEGPDRDAVQEPLTVQVVDGEGAVHRARRDGPGQLVLPTLGGARIVELDPEGRLVELWHPPGYSARFDNRDPARWRFLLENISGLLSVTGQQITAAVDFSLHRIQDLTWMMEYYLAVSPSSFGVAITGDYNFGREITPLRLSQGLSLTLAYSRLRTGYGATIPGDQITLSGEYGLDTRLGRYSDFEGDGIDALVRGGIGRDLRGNNYLYGLFGLSGLHIFKLGLNHAIVARLRGDVIVGQAPIQSLLSLGDRYLGARGFEYAEARGYQRGLLSAEYRHVLQGQSRTDFLGALLLTRLEGAFFADAVYMPVVDQYCPQRFFFDVGYGIRLLMDILNLSPVSVQLDFGIPINRCPAQISAYPPFTLYVSFVESFLSF